MDKKKSWLLAGILIPILITAILLMITISGNGGAETDSTSFSFASFFVIFILPGIIAQQRKKREQLKIKNNLENDF